MSQALCKDARTVPAGGAAEIEIMRQLGDFGRCCYLSSYLKALGFVSIHIPVLKYS